MQAPLLTATVKGEDERSKARQIKSGAERKKVREKECKRERK